ncbi:MAG: hypothetical protein WEE89_05610 [Gemmatimonadota bacterium]
MPVYRRAISAGDAIGDQIGSRDHDHARAQFTASHAVNRTIASHAAAIGMLPRVPQCGHARFPRIHVDRGHAHGWMSRTGIGLVREGEVIAAARGR